MIKIINYFLQSLIIYSFFFLGLILRLNVSRKIYAILFGLLGPVFKSKKIINNNLNIFSNKISNFDKKEIVNGMWENYGKTFIEYIFLSQLRKQKSHIKVIGENNLLKITQDKKPVIFVSGHFANFELMSMEITKRNISLATIYRPLNNIFLNPFMEFLRKKYICKNQIKKGFNGVRESIEYINKKCSIALMIDQRVSEGARINFFGKPALTTTLPAQLSIKYNLGIIPIFIQRDEHDKFKIEFQREIKPNHYKNKFELTNELNKILEKMIVRNPNQWIWTHDRWK